MDLAEYLNGYKKGSKKIRKILDNSLAENIDIVGLRTVISFSEIVDLVIPQTSVLKNVLALWSLGALTNEHRSILFFEQNNTLPVNARLNAINANINGKCTFCRIIDWEGATRETFMHFFLNCPVSRNLIQIVVALCDDVPPLNTINFRKLYWYGIFFNDDNNIISYLTFFSLIRVQLYKFKLRRKIPNPDSFKNEFLFNLTCILHNRRLYEKFRAIPMFSRILQAIG